jgi:transposase
MGTLAKEDFRCIADEDVCICPAEDRKPHCTPGKERRISRWEHEEALEAVQKRLDENPQAMRQSRDTVEHPFGPIQVAEGKMRMGATHVLMKRLKNVRTEMALSVLAHTLTRVINILGVAPLIQAIRA